MKVSQGFMEDHAQKFSHVFTSREQFAARVRARGQGF
jgi:hypothetical protein